MKKYIAPEMEVANFKMVDVLTVSEPAASATIVANSGAAELQADGAITFSTDGAF